MGAGAIEVTITAEDVVAFIARAAVEASGGAALAAVLAASEVPPGTDKLPDDWPADGRPPG